MILDNIRSLENVGSIFRTADALGVSKIFLCGYTAKPPVGESIESFLQRKGIIEKINKTALGAVQSVDFEYCESTSGLIRKMRQPCFAKALQGSAPISIVALEQDQKSVAYDKFKPKFPLALILGNEVDGVSKKVLSLCDKIIELPMRGKKESLNVAVSFGVAGYEINKNRYN